MKPHDVAVPFLLVAWVAAAAALFGFPAHETLNANNARAIGGDLVSVALPDGTTKEQHLTNNGGHANAPDIQAYINQGNISCSVIGLGVDRKDDIGCSDLSGRPLGGIPKL